MNTYLYNLWKRLTMSEYQYLKEQIEDLEYELNEKENIIDRLKVVNYTLNQEIKKRDRKIEKLQNELKLCEIEANEMGR